MADLRERVPRYLHLPPQVLWFDMQDVGVIIAMYFFWIMVDHWIVFVLMIVVPAIFKDVKARMPRGFLKHLAYRLGFWNSKNYPPTAVRVHHE